MQEISIITPTRNRAHLLPRLFASLQSCALAQWVIVDDGSSDDTTEVVKRFQETAPFEITLLTVPHGGKHRALSRGFQAVRTDWAAIIDSDDWLRNDGADALGQAARSAALSDADLAFVPVCVQKAPQQYCFRKPDRTISYVTLLKEEKPFDCTVIVGPRLLKQTWPSFENETFLAESMFFVSAAPLPLVFLAPKPAVNVEYQPDGLSARSIALRMAAPVGATALYQRLAQLPIGLDRKLRFLLNYGRFWWHGVLRRTPPRAPESILQMLALFVAWPLTVSDFARRRKERRLRRLASLGSPSE